MRHNKTSRVALLCALALGPGVVGLGAQASPRRMRPVAEFTLAPILGIDRPLKGGSCTMLVGLAKEPFEADLRAGMAYDNSLGIEELRLDFALGLGSGLRLLVGGLLPLGDIMLPDPKRDGARISVEAASWPNRFGFGVAIFESPWRLLAARLGLDAELVYTSYSLSKRDSREASSLVGAAAFAAGVEATIAFRLRWERRSTH